jgi:hypothetical protein
MGTFYSPSIVRDGLVLYLDAANPKCFYNGKSNIVSLSDNSTTGSLGGATWNTASLGSINFGGNQSITMSGDFSSVWTGSWTICSWFKIERTAFRHDPIIGGVNGAGTAGFFFGTDLGRAGFYFTSGGRMLSKKYLNYGAWQHVTCTSLITGQGGGSTRKIYMDGVFNNENTGSSSTISSTTYTTYMGRIPNISSYHAKSDVGNIMLYNRVLSDEEIYQIYAATKGRFKKNISIDSTNMVQSQPTAAVTNSLYLTPNAYLNNSCVLFGIMTDHSASVSESLVTYDKRPMTLLYQEQTGSIRTVIYQYRTGSIDIDISSQYASASFSEIPPRVALFGAVLRGIDQEATFSCTSSTGVSTKSSVTFNNTENDDYVVMFSQAGDINRTFTSTTGSVMIDLPLYLVVFYVKRGRVEDLLRLVALLTHRHQYYLLEYYSKNNEE